MQLDEEEKEAILDHPDVKRAMWILSDLILGKKKIVIETTHHAFNGQKTSPIGAYSSKHTFTLEETEHGREEGEADNDEQDSVQGDAEQHSEGEA
jgi:hypothetical protein